MKLTLNWLKEFIPVSLSASDLAEKLTMAGLEVVAVEMRDDDTVFEIEITSNRPDWLSIAGIARETAAIISKPCIAGSVKSKASLKTKSLIKIEIENNADCPLYYAAQLQKVEVRSSPHLISKRLELIGVRSINNVVDITNYILFEYGQPLHAFDYNKLQALALKNGIKPLGLFVRRAKEGEKITVIDGSVQTLNSQILIIAFGESIQRSIPVAIAGIMGGKDTEVDQSTKEVVLESAYFNPMVIRKASRLLGLQSDSSYRFERSVDISSVGGILMDCVKRLEKMCECRCVGVSHKGQVLAASRKVTLSQEHIKAILGIEVSMKQAASVLKHLGFQITSLKSCNLIAGVPTFRADVKEPIDLIEEVGRILGFVKIPLRSKPVISGTGFTSVWKKAREIKTLLLSLGFSEAITYSMVDKRSLISFGFDINSCVEISKPLSKDQEVLRPTLLLSLGRAVATNLNQKQDAVLLFEIARKYVRKENAPKEEWMLSIVCCGQKRTVYENGAIVEEYGLLHLKGALEVLAQRLGVGPVGLSSGDNQKTLIKVQEQEIGFMLELNSTQLDVLDVKNKRIFALEISLDALISLPARRIQYQALSRFPGSIRDVSIVIKDQISFDAIAAVIYKQGGALIRSVKAVDIYKGKQIPAGFKNLTISCLFRHDEKTLTENEINSVYEQVCLSLKQEFGSQIR